MPFEEQKNLIQALRESLKDNERLKQLNRKIASAQNEPIAIVSMSCRCPAGADTPEALWKLLAAGGEAIGAFPRDRGWDLEALQRLEPALRTRSFGGFIDDISGFDPLFFNISPREAVATDPQQRLLLETAWEALERAGIEPGSLQNSPTGVFVGLGVPDFLFLGAEEQRGMAVMSIPSVASGRISYTLGLHGPALTVDTACSSSLVTLHLACQSLRKGECDLALAGGATLMSTPNMFLESSGQGVVSSDGRCRPFGKGADGTIWGEAVGMLLLERLSDAQRHGHPVLAVMRGSAINQDGRSQGLTAPHGPAQEEVIRLALANAGLASHQIDALEAHGTGTALGDPIEAEALRTTYGAERTAAQPLWIGSLKSNIGHAQAAAGVIGVIKMVLALEHELLPKTLHAEELLPSIDWSPGTVRVLHQALPFPRHGQPRRVAVSAFGVSGTNAHVILEEAPSELPPMAAKASSAAGSALPFVLSARSESALPAQAASLRAHLLANPALSLLDVAHSLAHTRSAFEARVAIVAADRDALLQQLQQVAQGEACADTTAGQARVTGKLVFVFPGQGAQWVGMARGLIAQSEVFAQHMAACAEALAPHVPWSLADVIASDDPQVLEPLDVVQPMLFAVMTSLAALWRSYGVEPDAVIGHSQGEIAAAYVAGALSLDDAARLVAVRSRLQLKAAESPRAARGAMAAVELSADALAARIERFGERLSIAAINGPSAVVVAGEADALDALLEELAQAEVMARRMRAAGAGHTAQVEPLEAELLETFAELTPRSTHIPFYSCVEAGQVAGELLDAAYWYRNMRYTVRFAEVVEQLRASGHRFFVEVSAHPVLGHALQSSLGAANSGAARVASLRRNQGDLQRFMLSLCELYVCGRSLDWSRVFTGGKRVALPTYVFQRERYWPSADSQLRDLAAAGLESAKHPLLGASLQMADGEATTLTGRLSRSSHAWLGDRKQQGAWVVPASVFVELALAAAQQVGLNSLPQLNLDAALVLPEQGGVCIQLTLTAADADGQRALIVSGKLEDVASGWTRHAHALLGAAPEDAGDTLDELSTWPPADDQALALDALYRGLSADGLEYTDSSRSLRAAYRSGEGVLLGEIELPSRAIKEAQRYALHPGLLEGALQLLALATPQPEAFQTVSVSGVRLFATGASRVRARVQIVAPGEATIDLADEAGQPLAQLALVRTRPLGDRAPLEQAHRGRLYRLDWQPIQLPPAAASSFMSGCLVGHPASTALASRPYYPDMAGLCAAIANGATPPQLIVLACAPADPQSAERALAAIQRFVATEPLAASRLVVLTQRAFALEDDLALDLTHAPVWGLVRVLQNEYPDRRVALLDWDGREETSSQALFAGLAAEEAQLLTRDGELLVPRLSETPPSAAGSGLALAPEDTVVISGETAWLGAQLARHLVVEHGARQLLVCSTSAAADALRAELGGVLAGLGVQTRVAVCDLRVRQQVAALLDAIPASTPLRAVFHLTPRLDDVPIASLSTEHLAQAESGAVHLHELTRERELRAFVLFSSLAGTLGQRERGAYAAACSGNDALAQRRRCLGLPGQSVLFGLWAEPTASGSALVTPLSVADNLRLLDTALALPLPLIAAAAFDPRLPDLAPEVVPTALRSLLRRRLRRAGVLGAGAGSLQLRLRRAAPGTRTRTLLNALLAAVSETLRVEKSKLDPKRALTELGMDSIRALELRSLLAELSQLALPATLLFDHPTPNALAAYLEPRLLAAQSSQTPASAGDSAAPLVAMCTQSRAAGPALRSPIWRLIDAATSLRVQSPGGRAKSGLASRGYALSQGCGGALLICIPALVPPTGPGQYIRFATALAGKRDVSVVSVPGWSLAEALPEDRESLIACLCDSVLALAGERAFVLCGWSSGGWVAHALSATLARRKATPAALVMFDARQIAAEDFAVDPATGLSNVRVNMPVPGQAATQATCDEELTAWTWYFEMFADWLPERLACPSLQFDATGEVPVAEMRLVAHRTPLVAADEVIPLPAHHWSMMIDGAPQTAQHVDAWLDRISLAERAAKPAT